MSKAVKTFAKELKALEGAPRALQSETGEAEGQTIVMFAQLASRMTPFMKFGAGAGDDPLRKRAILSTRRCSRKGQGMVQRQISKGEQILGSFSGVSSCKKKLGLRQSLLRTREGIDRCNAFCSI